MTTSPPPASPRSAPPARQRVVPIGLFVVCMAPSAVLYAVYWLQPEPSHATATGAFLDSGITVASFVFAGSLVLTAWPRQRTATARLAATAASVPAIAVLVAVRQAARPDWVVVAAAALALLASLWMMFRLRLLRASSALARTMAVALPVVTIPLFGFWQQASYLPSQNQVSLTVSPTAVVQVDPTDGRHWVVTVKAENKETTSSVVVLSNLVVCHWHDEGERARAAADVASGRGPRDILDRSNCHKLNDPFVRGSRVDAGGALTNVDSTPAAPNLPYLEVRARVAVARDDRFRPGGPAHELLSHPVEGCWSMSVTPVQADSAYKSMAERTYLLLYYARDR